MKCSHELTHWFWPALFLLVPLASATIANPATANTAPTLPTVKISCPNKFSGGEGPECKVGVGEDHADEIRINLASENPSLVLPDVNQVTLAPHQLVAKVTLKSYSTPIKTTVIIKASLSNNNLIYALQTIEVVPALIQSATLTTSSIVGTNGAKTSCQIKLRVPAPTGGIEIYLSPLIVSPVPNRRAATLDVQNPRVPAGSNAVNFDIPYDRIELEGERVAEFRPDSRLFSDFNEQTRTVELVVALDPPDVKVWSPIPGIANKVTFQVVPLRVASLTVQPTTLSGGNEALANLTLSAPPGPSERALFQPIKGTSSKIWVTLIGSSCGASPSTTTASLEFPFTAGTTTYSFKVCSAPVSTVTPGNIRVFLKSGEYQSPFTVQP